MNWFSIAPYLAIYVNNINTHAFCCGQAMNGFWERVREIGGNYS